MRHNPTRRYLRTSEDFSKVSVREILKFIHIKEEIFTLIFWHIRTTHCRHIDLWYHDKTEGLSIGATIPFWEIYHGTFYWSITWRRLNADFVWPMILRIVVLVINGPNFCWEEWNHFLLSRSPSEHIHDPRRLYHHIFNFWMCLVISWIIRRQRGERYINEVPPSSSSSIKLRHPVSEIVLDTWTKYFISIHLNKDGSCIERSSILFR